MTWSGKCKSEVTAGTRIRKYNLRTRSVNEFFSVRAGKHKLGARVGKSKFGQGPVNTNLRPELVNAN